jgi:hypothetical protein
MARWDLGCFCLFHIFNSQFCDVAEVEIVPSPSLPFRCGVGPSDWQEDYGPRFPKVWIREAAAAGWCSSASGLLQCGSRMASSHGKWIVPRAPCASYRTERFLDRISTFNELQPILILQMDR